MSTPLLLACLWGIAASAVALLPMRTQILPGLVLLALAGPLLWSLAGAHGIGMALVCGAGLVSMYRRPLLAVLQRRVP